MRVDRIQRLSPAGSADFRQLRRVAGSQVLDSIHFYALSLKRES